MRALPHEEPGRSRGAHPAHRGSIFLEEGPSSRRSPGPASNSSCASRRPSAPRAHCREVSCTSPAIPTCPCAGRYPSNASNAREGWIEILYKIVGPGLRALSRRRAGDAISVLGPIGQPFRPDPKRPRALLVGGGVGIPPMVFLAEWMSGQPGKPWKPLVLMGSEIPFPFKTRPSTILVSGIPAGSIGAMPLLDGWGVPSRLASKAGFPGCYDGFVTQLADEWLGALDAPTKAEVEVFSCGPTPMLEAMAKVAAKHDVPCQVSLEEFMACAVGGCAGCTVKVATPDGPAMKRVCVDGPVFDSKAVFG